MRNKKSIFKIFSVISGFLVLLSACTSEEPSSSPDTTEFQSKVLDPELRAQNTQIVTVPEIPENTLVWLHDQEPVSLHADDPDNAGASTAKWVQQGLLEGLFGVDSTLSYYPELLQSEPTIEKQKSGKVVIKYKLRPNLSWSDGKPLTASDVKYTFNIIKEGCAKEGDGSFLDSSNKDCFYKISSRRGYSLITNFEVIDNTNFKITFSGVFPNYKSLFPVVFAEHAFGKNAIEVNENLATFTNSDSILPSSGPLKFSSWERGVSLNLRQNDTYHGSQSPDAAEKGISKIENISVKFLPNVESLKKNLEDGNGHFILTDVSTAFEDLVNDENVTPAAVGSEIFEHVGMSLANAHLEKVTVRQAVAEAIDKSSVVAELYKPLFGPALPTDGTGNSYWMPNQPAYIDHQQEYGSSGLSAVNDSMQEAGYSKGADGFWAHLDDGKVTLRFVTIKNDTFRERQQEIIKSQLEAAGFEIEINNLVGSEFYRVSQSAPGPFASKTSWDLVLFAWAGGPWPGGQSSVYGGKASTNKINNIYGYSSSDFDAASKKCDLLTDQKELEPCYNNLDKFATTNTGTTGLFIVPISQKPQFFASRSDLIDAGVVQSSEFAGPLINIADFSIS